jgi:hypothetical protein
MRTAVFRVLAGLLAVAFVALLAFGDTSRMSLRERVGAGIIGVGFGLYALLGSDLGERLIGWAFGIRDPGRGSEPPGHKPAEPGATSDRGGTR